MFAEIDKYLRNLFSILYRIIISGYIILILCFRLGWENTPWFTILYSILLYLFLSFLLRSKVNNDDIESESKTEKIKAWIRLSIDYGVIIFYVKGSDLNLFHNYFVLVLPIINSINHSLSDNKNIIVYLFSTGAIFYIDKWTIYESHYVPILVLFLIIQFFKFRYRISRYKDKLFKIIDDFYGDNAKKDEMSSILNSLKTQINSTLGGVRFGKMEIKNISCFKQKSGELILISSGEFVENYGFTETTKLIDSLKSGIHLQNVQFLLNGNIEKHNVLFKAKGNYYTYVYLITFKRPLIILNSIIVLRLVIEPSFKHLSKLLEVKWIISSERRKLYEEVRKKHEYVIKSMEVLHFVNGALSPFSILNAAIKRYKDDNDEDRKLINLQRIYSLSERSNSNMQTIAKRAEMIYDKENNPFIANELKQHSFPEMFAWIRRSWEEATESKSVTISRDEGVDILNYKIKYDEELFDAVMIELFQNISKHSNDIKKLEFIITEVKIEVRFINGVKSITNKKIEEIKKLASKHNTETRPSINQRDSERFGLYIIKDYLFQMGMESQISIDSKKIYSHTIIIKKAI